MGLRFCYSAILTEYWLLLLDILSWANRNIQESQSTPPKKEDQFRNLDFVYMTCSLLHLLWDTHHRNKLRSYGIFPTSDKGPLDSLIWLSSNAGSCGKNFAPRPCGKHAYHSSQCLIRFSRFHCIKIKVWQNNWGVAGWPYTTNRFCEYAIFKNAKKKLILFYGGMKKNNCRLNHVHYLLFCSLDL